MCRYIYLILFWAGCISCSSAPEPIINYYVLPTYKTTDTAVNSNEFSPSSKVTIILAPWLQKENLLVMQDETRVVFAHYHRWAQPLEYMLKTTFERQLKPLNNFQNVTIQFDKLHGSREGLVTLQGWFMIDQTTEQSFLIHTQQAQVGYSAMVEALTEGLLDLSRTISSKM